MKRKIKILSVTFIVILVGIFVYFYLPKILSDTVYPLEYKDLIKKYATEYQLDPNFVAGVIFSESHFNAHATSPVGARGLMQIMPQTGRGIARSLGEEASYSPDKLYNPETNIKYGCWYLRNLTNKYPWDVSYVLIAYNGGVALADRFATYGGSLNAETSYYYVKVQKNKQIYDQLYGKWWESEKKVKMKPTLKDIILSWMLGR
ncbi:MAG TPA: lytic transglycosylase domain-containing protein [Patescibacteria group bacterium]|nr:lytic transglycosylase domain-containing protein [Patescibacteria group bacterium]